MNYYTSDHHFGHRRIIEYSKRPFQSVEEMNQKLADNINDVVSERDVLFHLGDFAFGDKKNSKSQLAVSQKFREMINCKHIVLIWGNHDRLMRKEPKFTRMFDQVEEMMEIMDPHLGRRIILCHYAMVVYNGSHYGQNLHAFGHSHGNLNNWLDEHMPGHLAMDVGVDNAYKLFGEYRPISSQEFGDVVLRRAVHRTADYPLCVPPKVV